MSTRNELEIIEQLIDLGERELSLIKRLAFQLAEYGDTSAMFEYETMVNQYKHLIGERDGD